MSELVRRTTSSSGAPVLLVRRPVRSVRAAHEASPLPVRLAIGVIVGVGVIAVLWLMGFLGFHMGFAPLVSVPELRLSRGGALVAAAMMILSIPMTILRAGMAQPLWLMVGFLAIAIPAGSLGAVKPRSPGGPRTKPLIVAASIAGAVAAAVFCLALVWWVASPLRHNLIEPIPASVVDASLWLAELRLAAGMDVFAAIAASLWVVLIMRLSIPRWVRGLSGGVAYVALGIILTAMAMTNVTVAQMTLKRSVAVAFEGATVNRVLLLGEAFGQLATVRAGGGDIAVELIDRPARLRVVDRRGLSAFLAEYVEESDDGY